MSDRRGVGRPAGSAENPSLTKEGQPAVGRFEDEWGRTYPRLQILTLAEQFGARSRNPFHRSIEHQARKARGHDAAGVTAVTRRRLVLTESCRSAASQRSPPGSWPRRCQRARGHPGSSPTQSWRGLSEDHFRADIGGGAVAAEPAVPKLATRCAAAHSALIVLGTNQWLQPRRGRHSAHGVSPQTADRCCR